MQNYSTKAILGAVGKAAQECRNPPVSKVIAFSMSDYFMAWLTEMTFKYPAASYYTDSALLSVLPAVPGVGGRGQELVV